MIPNGKVPASWWERILSMPSSELNRGQKAIRFLLNLFRFGAGQLQQDRASEMAAALAFRTLFGLLPVLVVTSVLVKAMDMHQHLMRPLEQLFSFWGLDNVRILVPSSPGEENIATVTLSVWLRDRIREAESVSLATIGWVGLIVTIYAALSLVVTIEECFNVIYRAPQGRSWTRRVPIYWFALTISPLILVVGTNLNQKMESWMATTQVSYWWTFALGLSWSLLVIWILMFTVYYLIPNTRVHVGPALAGSLIAAILLELGKRTLGLYLENALSLSQLYGSLGLIPLFMFWVYIMWLAVLFGLQVSSTLQHLHGRQLAEIQEKMGAGKVPVDPLTLAGILGAIATRFHKGKPSFPEEIARETGLPERVLHPILVSCAEEQLIHEVGAPRPGYVLAAPPSEIRMDRLALLSRQWMDAQRGTEESKRVKELRLTQDQLLNSLTLEDLVKSPSSPVSG